MKWLVRSRSPRDRSQYCRGLHTSGNETTASARNTAHENADLFVQDHLCLLTHYILKEFLSQGRRTRERPTEVKLGSQPWRWWENPVDPQGSVTRVSHPREGDAQELVTQPREGKGIFWPLCFLTFRPYPIGLGIIWDNPI